MVRRAGAAVVLIGCIALSACTSTDAEPTVPSAPTTVSTTSSSSTTAPPATATPTGAPLLPDAARQQTPEGAEAFVRHWFDLFNYSFTALDSAALLSAGNCLTCQQLAKTIDEVAARGHTLTGGQAVVSTVDPAANITEGGTTVTVAFASTSAQELGVDGALVEEVDPGGSAVYLFTLTWGQGWQASMIQLLQ